MVSYINSCPRWDLFVHFEAGTCATSGNLGLPHTSAFFMQRVKMLPGKIFIFADVLFWMLENRLAFNVI